MITHDDAGGRTSEYWRGRAEQARTMADGMRNGFAEAMMREIGRMYDGMAERAAKVESAKKHSGSNGDTTDASTAFGEEPTRHPAQ
jgi:hypothetical protein